MDQVLGRYVNLNIEGSSIMSHMRKTKSQHCHGNGDGGKGKHKSMNAMEDIRQGNKKPVSVYQKKKLGIGVSVRPQENVSSMNSSSSSYSAPATPVPRIAATYSVGDRKKDGSRERGVLVFGA